MKNLKKIFNIIINFKIYKVKMNYFNKKFGVLINNIIKL